MQLGKQAYRADPRTFQLGRYLTAQLPAPPPSLDLSSKVADWPLYANNTLKNCACAAAAHMIELWSAASGQPVTPPQAEIIAMYSAITGYQPGQPSTDTGAVELDVLNWWRKNSLNGYTIDAFALITATQHDHLRQALLLFDGVLLGLNLPRTARAQVGQLWDVSPPPAPSPAPPTLVPPAPGPVGAGSTAATAGELTGDDAPGSWGGHAVNLVAYDDQSLTVVTWGLLQRLSWPFFDAYCDEAWALLPANWKAIAPAGFDFQALEADLAQLGTPQPAQV